MTLSAWEVLGIEETADSRAIRRAYAARLKATRPEEDATAFQLLTDAFEWACADARRLQNEQAAAERPSAGPPSTEPEPSVPAPDAPLPELGKPLDAEPAPADGSAPATADGSEGEERSFAFGPFFEALAEEIRKRDPKHLRAWLDAHPELYSLELKWALTPHVFDTLAHNASVLDPHRGHLETLMHFFGVDARLRRHPALAPALDFLELGQWREQKPAASSQKAPMPAGWENLANVMDESRQGPPPPRKPLQGTWSENLANYWWVFIVLMVIGKLSAFFSQ